MPQEQGRPTAVPEPEHTMTEDAQRTAEAFVRRHGADALTALLEQGGEFLESYKLEALPTVLSTAILWGDLRPRSRFHVDQAVRAMRMGLCFTMVAKAAPSEGKRKAECVDVTSMVGDSVVIDMRMHEQLSTLERAAL